MSLLVGKNTRVIIQGITGKQGMKIAAEMLDYGTNVVGGVTPGKGGSDVNGIPVYNTVEECLEEHPDVNTSVISVPRNQAKDAAAEAISTGQIALVNILTEGIPSLDSAYIVDYARDYGTRIVGPASVGIISPKDRIKLGAIGGNDPGAFYPGNIAIFSKSGGMSMSLALEIFNKLGCGVSIVVGIGGDKIIGTTFRDLLELYRDDPDTKLILLNGEVGGNYEEEAAAYFMDTAYPKKVIARMSGIGGEALFAQGSRMGHAGAIIGEGSVGSYASKVEAFEAAGIPVAKSSEDLITLVERVMPRRAPDFEKAIASEAELVSISKPKLEALKTQARAVRTKTGLTQLRNGVPYLLGYALPDLIREASIPEVAYMALHEEDPSPETLSDFMDEWDAVRSERNVSQIALDAALASYNAGNSLNAACAAGLLAAPDIEHEISEESRVSPEIRLALQYVEEVMTIAAHILGTDTAPLECRRVEEEFFVTLAGRAPSIEEADVARGMFISCIEHTPATPSSLAALTSYSGGNSLKTALAAGISAMGDVHAGAGEGTAHLLRTELDAYNEAIPDGDSYQLDGVTIVSEHDLAKYIVDKSSGKFGGVKQKIPGYGHRYYGMYGRDARAVALLQVAEVMQVAGPHVRLALEIEKILKEEKSSGLCLNVDGAIGALIADMCIGSNAAKATFIIPRTIGILAELIEQSSGSFFRLANESIVYTGPEPGRVYVPMTHREVA